MREMGVGTRAARTLWALALAALLACGAVLAATPQQAQAAKATNCTFTVNVDVSNAGAYAVKGYRLFSAEVDDTTNAAKEAEWNSDYESAVKAFLNSTSNGASQTYSAWLTANGLTDDATNALTYIADEISNSTGLSAVGGRTATSPGSFSTQLAAVLAGQAETVASAQNVDADNPYTFAGLTEGFYLFYAEGQPPMWTPVGGSEAEGTVKNPLVLAAEKSVWDDALNGWGKITDAGNEQEVKFRVTGEAPNAVPTSAYKYNLTDTLPVGLTPSTADVKVYAWDGTTEHDITGRFTADVSGQDLTVTCADLYGAGPGASLMQGGTVTHVIFEYTATVNGNATMGKSYNTNSAVVEYGTDSSGYETEPATANVTAYQIKVVKEDSGDSSKKLEGAEFELSTTDASGATWYVQADGTLGTAAEKLTTGSDGTLTVQRIDAGTYTLTETKAPENYKLPAVTATNIVITPTLDQADGELDSWTVTADNGATVKDTISSGLVEVTIVNDPTNVLPVTGMTPDQTGTAIGALLVLAGVVALAVRSRRRAGSRA